MGGYFERVPGLWQCRIAEDTNGGKEFNFVPFANPLWRWYKRALGGSPLAMPARLRPSDGAAGKLEKLGLQIGPSLKSGVGPILVGTLDLPLEHPTNSQLPKEIGTGRCSAHHAIFPKH